MVELIVYYGWICVVVIGVDDWYGCSGVDVFVIVVNEIGICIVL